MFPSTQTASLPYGLFESSDEDSDLDDDPIQLGLIRTRDIVALDREEWIFTPSQPPPYPNAEPPPPYAAGLPFDLPPDSHGNKIPQDAAWTKIDRRLVSARALDRWGVRYEARPTYVAVLGLLSKADIIKFVNLSSEIRKARYATGLRNPNSKQRGVAKPEKGDYVPRDLGPSDHSEEEVVFDVDLQFDMALDEDISVRDIPHGDMAGDAEGRLTGIESSADMRYERTRQEGGQPSQKEVLSEALSKGNAAVQLDHKAHLEAARVAYAETGALLQQALDQTTAQEDVQKLKTIVSAPGLKSLTLLLFLHPIHFTFSMHFPDSVSGLIVQLFLQHKTYTERIRELGNLLRASGSNAKSQPRLPDSNDKQDSASSLATPLLFREEHIIPGSTVLLKPILKNKNENHVRFDTNRAPARSADEIRSYAGDRSKGSRERDRLRDRRTPKDRDDHSRTQDSTAATARHRNPREHRGAKEHAVNKTLDAVGLGGAAASLLSVLTEAASHGF